MYPARRTRGVSRAVASQRGLRRSVASQNGLCSAVFSQRDGRHGAHARRIISFLACCDVNAAEGQHTSCTVRAAIPSG